MTGVLSMLMSYPWASTSFCLIGGFRPGVAERLGLGPEHCMAHNPKLVYGLVTGWGQDGPLSQTTGHDINYIALAGILEAQKSDQGQVIDAAMLDGILYQMSLYFTLAATDSWREKRGSNQLDGGAPYYRTY